MYIAEKQIDGYFFGIRPIEAEEGLHLLVDLAKTIGPAFADDPGVAARELATSLNAGKVVEIVQTLSKYTDFDPEGGGQPRALRPVWKTEFSGQKIALLVKWLGFAIQANFANLPEAFAELGLDFGGAPTTSVE